MNMTNPRISSYWSKLAIIAGGFLMAAFWLLYINLHGPTSYSQGGHWLGRGPEFWGMIMNAPASLLIALGLWGHYKLLAKDVSHLASIGFVLVQLALVLQALGDIVILAIGPPFLMPIGITGLLLVALANRRTTALHPLSQPTLQALGLLCLFAFPMFLMPLDIFDQIKGYTIYGILAHFLFGLGWTVFGFILKRA